MEFAACAAQTWVALCGHEYVQFTKTVTFHRWSLGDIESGNFKGSV